MFYFTFATLFAQAVITIRFAAASSPSREPLIAYQDIRRHEEQSVDRLLSRFSDLRSVCFRDLPFDPVCARARYVAPSRSLKERQTRIP
jgi:hypothetical protein